MDIHPWTKYEVAALRDEERLLRAMSAYKALRGADGGAIETVVEGRSSRMRLLDRLLRRDFGAVPTSPRAVG